MKELGWLQNCKLDEANWGLRKGYASEENAIAYIEAWNKPGHRLTKAELYHTLVSIPGLKNGLMAPQIRIKGE